MLELPRIMANGLALEISTRAVRTFSEASFVYPIKRTETLILAGRALSCLIQMAAPIAVPSATPIRIVNALCITCYHLIICV
jgi:hypothetical protein